MIYASWNGSTEVRKWQVLASENQSGPFTNLGPPVRWSSFETKIQRTTANCFEVQALGAGGRVLATSAAVAG